MVKLKSSEEVELIQQNCLIVSRALARVAEILKPGVTGTQIDRAAEEVVKDHGAVPGFKGYGGFPATLCVSKNACVVHGIPNETPFEEGDIVSVDCGSFRDGYYGDAAYTFAIGDISETIFELLLTTKESLYEGIEKVKPGNRIGCIGEAIQKYCEKQRNYGVVRELVGHGVGRNLHEKPNVPNFGRCGRGYKMKKGLVIAIEPMVNLGTKEIVQLKDGWSIVSKDRSVSAHYEHTVAVTENGYKILSDHSFLEEAIKNNENLKDISRKN